RYAVIVNTLYLDRRLVGALARALRPGGLLLFETFTVDQLATGHPRNPSFVLAPGELPRLVGGLRVVAYREGPIERDGRLVHLASLAARAPGGCGGRAINGPGDRRRRARLGSRHEPAGDHRPGGHRAPRLRHPPRDLEPPRGRGAPARGERGDRDPG